MKTFNIAFFTEAGSKRGMGHLIRSYTIFEAFKNKGFQSTFFLDSDIDYSYKFKDIENFTWKSFSLTKKFDVIVIDSYEADLAIYQTISEKSKVAIYIDDFVRLSYPKGMIINFAPQAQKMFQKHKKENSIYLLGLDYIPIRQIFFQYQANKQNKIFVMLGGNDIQNLSLEVLQAIENLSSNITLVTNNQQTFKKLPSSKKTHVLYKPSDQELVKEISQTTVAITTASMSVYELAFYNIPTIILAISKNQLDGVEQLIQSHLADKYIDIKSDNWGDELRSTTQKLIESNNSKTTPIDGYGTTRIISKVMELLS